MRSSVIRWSEALGIRRSRVIRETDRQASLSVVRDFASATEMTRQMAPAGSPDPRNGYRAHLLSLPADMDPMNTEEQSGKPALPSEISAALKGRRIGLCGFDATEARRISDILDAARAMPLPFHQQLLGDSLRVCDAVAVKLLNIGAEGLRAAAKSPVPILVTGPTQVLLDGTRAAYSWPRDFMNELWSDAELLIRLFRMLETPCRCHPAAAQESRMEPLVLMADDDPEMVKLVAAVLRSDGITCQVAENGLAALRSAREIVPDLMLLDVSMPMLDGFEVLSVARCDPALQTMPVILLTSCNDRTDVMRGSELHADDYLTKPVNPGLVLNRVKRLLSRRGRSARSWAHTSARDADAGGPPRRRWTLTGSPGPEVVEPS
jgi:two-component system alkaline phosphatase synthesis response regulator PhoP